MAILTASPPAVEALGVESSSHVDGDPWPTLTRGWPFLHQEDEPR